MKKLLLVAGLLLMGACAANSTEPVARKSAAKASKDLICESGYLVAYDEQGNPYCAPIQ